MEQEQKIPQHIAIILDGNGRWAKKRRMPRSYGHTQGSRVVERICEDAYRMGVKYLTVYAFSTENWARPAEEVSALMNLLRSYLKDCIKTSRKNDMRVRIIGDTAALDADMRAQIAALEEDSKDNRGLCFQVALNYGGRDEILRAVRACAQRAAEGTLDPAGIDEEAFFGFMDMHDTPEPDLLIRTGGEQRISNFLLWELAYTEFYFTDVLWPDFTKEHLMEAIRSFNARERRRGGVKDETGTMG